MASIRQLYGITTTHWRILICLGVITLLSSCSPRVEPDLGYGPEGQPRILSVHLPGIPDRNIQLDQTTRQILVTIPSNFLADIITPVFQLTPDTYVVSKYTDSLKIYPLVANDSVRISTSRQKTNAYQFVFKPAGELLFAQLSAPLTLTVNPGTNYLCLPLFNFVDGETTGTLVLTNQQSGRRLHSYLERPDIESPCDHSKRTDGAVIAYTLIGGVNFYEPGDYTAEFIKPNGRRALLNQPVRLVRGDIKIYFDSNFPIILGGNGSTIYAANLFATDDPSLLEMVGFIGTRICLTSQDHAVRKEHQNTA